MYSANVGGYELERMDIKVFTEDKLGNAHYSSRLYKILSHVYDPGDWSIYVDADMFLPDVSTFVEELRRSGKDIGVFSHPDGRNCVYEEAEAIIRLGKDTEKNVKGHLDFYKSIGYPEHGGLSACGIIVRHHTEEIKRLNEKWWAEVCSKSRRDQMSFDYVFSGHIHHFKGNIYDYKIK